MASKNNVKPFMCETCNKRFTNKYYFNAHLRVHSGETPYVCPECKKGFSIRSNLTVHFCGHNGKKPFVCEICNKGFPRQYDLNAHFRVHTGERPFVCETCGKTFGRKTALNEHRRIHTGKKPYVCDVCQKGFFRRATHHVHTGEEVCEVYTMKIMETNKQIGEVAAAVPVIIARVLEVFIESLATKANVITKSRNATTITASHIKSCVLADSSFDFLKPVVSSVPDVQEEEEHKFKKKISMFDFLKTSVSSIPDIKKEEE